MAAISKTPSGSYRGVFTSQPMDAVVDAVNNLQGNGTAGPVAASSITGLKPTAAAAATAAITSAQAGTTIVLGRAAGVTATLPAATGSGNEYTFTIGVTATSAAYKILAASSSDNLVGFLTGETGGTAKCFVSVAATANHSLQMPFAGTQPSGGFEGDWFTFRDVAANTWHVSGCYQAGTTPTTPFSTATT
jgi:hypothetical protein